ncbi:MAG: cytochrome c [Acidobacteriota bacterium]
MRKITTFIIFLLLPFVVVGVIYGLSRDTSKRNLEIPSQMQYSPAAHSQSANTVLPNGMTQQLPVAGTVPRGFQPFHYGPGPEEADRAGRELANPMQKTAENLARGREVYKNYCLICHGATGAGDGPLIPKYPNPPSYWSEKSKQISDGKMFHIITLGRNTMPAHAGQVEAADRWRTILYIRNLQESEK